MVDEFKLQHVHRLELRDASAATIIMSKDFPNSTVDALQAHRHILFVLYGQFGVMNSPGTESHTHTTDSRLFSRLYYIRMTTFTCNTATL